MPPKKQQTPSSKSKSKLPAGLPELLDISTIEMDVCSHILAFLVCGYCLSYKDKFKKNIIYPTEQELRLKASSSRLGQDLKSATAEAPQMADVAMADEAQQTLELSEINIKFDLGILLINILSQNFGIPISRERLLSEAGHEPKMGVARPLHIRRIKPPSSPGSSLSGELAFKYYSGSESEPDFFEKYRRPDSDSRFKTLDLSIDFPDTPQHVAVSPFVTRTRHPKDDQKPFDGNFPRPPSPTSRWMSPTSTPSKTVMHGEAKQAYKCYQVGSVSGLHLVASDGFSAPIPCFMCNMYLFSLNYDPRGIHFNISNRWGIPCPSTVPAEQTPTKKGTEKGFPACEDFIGGAFFNSLFDFACTIQRHIDQSGIFPGLGLSVYFKGLKTILCVSDAAASSSPSCAPPCFPDRVQSFESSLDFRESASASVSDLASPISTSFSRLNIDQGFASPCTVPESVSPSFAPSCSSEGDSAMSSSHLLQSRTLAFQRGFAVDALRSSAFSRSQSYFESLASPSFSMSTSPSVESTPKEKTKASSEFFELPSPETTRKNLKKALDILFLLTQIQNPSLIEYYKVILYQCCLKATTSNPKPLWSTFYEWESLINPHIATYIKSLKIIKF